MTRSLRLLICLPLVSLALATSAVAQSPPTTRADEYERRQAEKARQTHPYVPGFFEKQLLRIEEGGGFTAVKGIGVAFGGIKSGSGLALGPLTGHTFANGALVAAKAVFSIRNYKLLQGFVQAPPLADGRLIVNGRVRWHDAPRGPVFAIGPNSPDLRAQYDEERTEVSAQALAHPVSFVRLAGGAGWEKFETSAGGLAVGEDEALPFVPQLPGLSADPRYLHSYAMGALDWRESPGYSRSGTLLQAAVHDFRAQSGGPYSFHRVEGVAQQLIPIMHGNIVFDLSARVWSATPERGSDVPFFLLPELGGGNFLRGFRNYRFRDRNAMLLTGQYRWYVQEYVDGVIFYEAGKVAPRFDDLDLEHLEKSYGLGLHLHTPVATVLRLELARSREGTRLIIGFSPPAF
jgi:hypothetical protein